MINPGCIFIDRCGKELDSKHGLALILEWADGRVRRYHDFSEKHKVYSSIELNECDWQVFIYESTIYVIIENALKERLLISQSSILGYLQSSWTRIW